MRLRNTQLNELEAIERLEADKQAAPFIIAWPTARHAVAIEDPDEAHLVLEVDEEIVGFVLLAGLRDPNHSIELRRIAVARPGEGLGRIGLDLVVRRAFEDLGAHRLWLDVKVHNLRAQRAYQRAGFRPEGVLRDALLTDDRRESLLVMSIIASDREVSAADSQPHVRLATRKDFDEILANTPDFWGEREVAHLHHPTFIEEFSDAALVIEDHEGAVAAYLFGMVLPDKRLGYIHVTATRRDQRSRGHARQLHCAFSHLAEKRGCELIKAITTPGNAASIAFHREQGMSAQLIDNYSGNGSPRVVLTRTL